MHTMQSDGKPSATVIWSYVSHLGHSCLSLSLLNMFVICSLQPEIRGCKNILPGKATLEAGNLTSLLHHYFRLQCAGGIKYALFTHNLYFAFLLCISTWLFKSKLSIVTYILIIWRFVKPINNFSWFPGKHNWIFKT